jgi:hypothetical protein
LPWASTVGAGALLAIARAAWAGGAGLAIDRATVRQKKTGRPVKFELTDQTRQAVDDYLKAAGKKSGDFLFTGRRAFRRTSQDIVKLLGATLIDFAWVAQASLASTAPISIQDDANVADLSKLDLLHPDRRVAHRQRPCADRCPRQVRRGS